MDLVEARAGSSMAGTDLKAMSLPDGTLNTYVSMNMSFQPAIGLQFKQLNL
jgi:hypothetical protein